MTRGRARCALALLVVGTVSGCGLSGALDPTEAPSPSAPSSAPATESPSPTPSPTPSAAPEPTQAPAATASAPSAPRTPPPLPPLPSPSIAATDVPAVGPELVDGSLYDYVVTCDPAIPMWLDDGDGAYAGMTNDRWVTCEESDVAVIAVGVGPEMRLLTLFEEDIGVPPAFRTVTESGFDAAVVAEIAAQSGVESVDMAIACGGNDGGLIDVGGRYAYCTGPGGMSELTSVPLAEALGQPNYGIRFAGQVHLRAG